MSSVFSLLDLSQRVNSVKEENKKLKTENDVSTDTQAATFLVQTCHLGCPPLVQWCCAPDLCVSLLQLLDQYIDNLMATSTFFSKTPSVKTSTTKEAPSS